MDLVTGNAWFKFTGEGGKQLLNTSVQVQAFDDDVDGTSDRYIITTTDPAGHALWVLTKRGGRGTEPGVTRAIYQGSFSMPWGIEVTVD